MSGALPVTAMREHSKGRHSTRPDLALLALKSSGSLQSFLKPRLSRSGIIDCELKAIHCRTLLDVRGQ
jgi:hypothetical protein